MIPDALTYAEKGWPIFPCKPGEKVPLTRNGVLDATTDIGTITRWWTETPDANIGLDVGGAGMMALDYDPGSSKEELEANVGPIPDTLLRSKTPRGGDHTFFALARGELVAQSSSKLAPHIDVRSFHSYVLLPPSKTKDGSYTWASTGKPAYRTDEMVRLSNAAKAKSKDRDNWIVEPDLRENIERAIRWLRDTARPAIQGQGGDYMAYKTAAYCKSLAISEDKAFDLMLEHWKPFVRPSETTRVQPKNFPMTRQPVAPSCRT